MKNGYCDETKNNSPNHSTAFIHIRDLFDTCFPIKKYKITCESKTLCIKII